MKVFLLVEGGSDEEILRQILPDKCLEKIKIVLAGGKNSLVSKARSLLIAFRSHVIVAADADTRDLLDVIESRQFIEQSLGLVATADRFSIVQFVPTIEILFVWDKGLLSHLANREVTDTEWLSAVQDPKRYLETLFGKSSTMGPILKLLDEQAITTIRAHEPVSQLIAAIEAVGIS